VGIFAAFAVALVSLGIYGLLSFAVTERTREIAVRAALGLDRGGIVGLMLGGAARVSAAGAATGLLAALALGRLLESLLLDVRFTDPASYVAAGLLILAVTLVAALLPSLRAARLDPVEALRRE
jgi:putative ABC transport system permease protein